MPGIVGTVSLPGEFLVHGNVPRRVGIVATPRIVGIRAAYQQALVLRVGQNADVVLTIGLIGSFEWFESLLNYRERVCVPQFFPSEDRGRRRRRWDSR